MKKSIRFVLAAITSISFSSFSQQIDSISVHPSQLPGVNDTIKIYTYLTFPYSGCAGSANWSQSGYTIGSSSIHCMGSLSAICHDIDTAIINPPHNKGTYTFIYVLSAGYGGPPCSPGIVPNDFDTAYFWVDTAMTPPPTNNPPGISTFFNDSVCKNDTLGPIAFSVSDEDVSSLSMYGFSDNSAIIPSSGLIFGGSGVNRTLTVIPVANQTGLVKITVVAVDNKFAADSTSFNVKVADCPDASGIASHNESVIRIFPNPANNEVFVYFPERTADLHIEIRNLQGQLLLTDVTTSGKNYRIGTEKLPQGSYLILLNSPEYTLTRKLLILR